MELKGKLCFARLYWCCEYAMSRKGVLNLRRIQDGIHGRRNAHGRARSIGVRQPDGTRASEQYWSQTVTMCIHTGHLQQRVREWSQYPYKCICWSGCVPGWPTEEGEEARRGTEGGEEGRISPALVMQPEVTGPGHRAKQTAAQHRMPVQWQVQGRGHAGTPGVPSVRSLPVVPQSNVGQSI